MSMTASALSQNALLSSQLAQQSAAQKAQNATPAQQNKAQLNAQIMEASAKVSLSGKNEAQALFFQTAAANISGQFNFKNTQVNFNFSYAQMQFGSAMENFQTNNSAQNTAGRILNFATSFFKGYQAQNAGKPPNEIAQNFIDKVRLGFEKGFNEAKDILQSLRVFQGDTQTNIEKTYSLVQQGFDQFLNQKMSVNSPMEKSPTV